MQWRREDRRSMKAVGFIPGFNYLRFHFKRNARVGLHQLEQFITRSSLSWCHWQQLVIELLP